MHASLVVIVGCISHLAHGTLSSPPIRAPTLLYNASGLTVGWEPVASAPPSMRYQLQLSVEQPGQPVFHVTRSAPSDARSLFWGDLPTDANCCFRIAASAGDALDTTLLYSDATCYSNCHCAAAASASSSCASCALFGALVGALLAAASYLWCAGRPSWQGSVCSKHAVSLARGLMGGAYLHVHTAEEVGLELDDSRMPPIAETAASYGASFGTSACAAHPAAGVPPALNPPADIDADQFELRWSRCATRGRVLEAPLPSLPPSVPDEIEAALVTCGFFCVAAGAVGSVHKLYFAGQLHGSADWLMLELVLHTQAASAQATFRCDSSSWLAPLAEDFAALIGRTMRTNFVLAKH